jgi:hypothetical protein
MRRKTGRVCTEVEMDAVIARWMLADILRFDAERRCWLYLDMGGWEVADTDVIAEALEALAHALLRLAGAYRLTAAAHAGHGCETAREYMHRLHETQRVAARLRSPACAPVLIQAVERVG